MIRVTVSGAMSERPSRGYGGTPTGHPAKTDEAIARYADVVPRETPRIVPTGTSWGTTGNPDGSKRYVYRGQNSQGIMGSKVVRYSTAGASVFGALVFGSKGIGE